MYPQAYHGFNVADIASDTPHDDRQKQFVHEKIACGYKSQLHFQTCNAVPVMVGEFSLAIDNCMPYLDARYADYGQCKDIKSRITSPWWKSHVKSFAMRQIATAERELGWAFWTYKVDDECEANEPSAAFWSFRLAAKLGFIDKSFYGRKDACTHAPLMDYDLGDAAYPVTKYGDGAALAEEQYPDVPSYQNEANADGDIVTGAVPTEVAPGQKASGPADADADAIAAADGGSGAVFATLVFVFVAAIGVGATMYHRAQSALDKPAAYSRVSTDSSGSGSYQEDSKLQLRSV
jgi:hypothetical protein